MDRILTVRPSVKNGSRLLFICTAKGVQAAGEMLRIANNLQRG